MSHPDDFHRLSTIIVHQFQDHSPRYAPNSLVKRIHLAHPQFQSFEIRNTIRSLVRKGVLIYSHHFSSSQLELNFQQYRSITDHIALCPAYIDPSSYNHPVVIKIIPGSAFGLGDHPTTRLSIKGIEFSLNDGGAEKFPADAAALDIGTGTGVLSLTAAKLGISRVTAVDIDPMARCEAQANVMLNGLEEKIEIRPASLEDLPDRKFALIMANLRPPTLNALMVQMARISKPSAYWVLSGFRPDEKRRLRNFLEQKRGIVKWASIENGWGVLVVSLEQRALKAI